MSQNAELSRIDALQSVGMHAEAVELAEAAVRKGAGMPIFLRLATSQIKLGHYREAALTTRLATSQKPSAPQDLIELSKRLMHFQFSADLVQLAKRQLAKPQWSAGLEADLATHVSMVGEQEVASRLLDRAIKVIGLSPTTLYNRSQLRMYLGAADQAESDLRRCLKLDPGSGKAFWALSKLGGATLSGEELVALEALANRATQGAQNETFASFALFNFHDRANQTGLAWAALERGCQLKRQSVNYDAVKSRQLVEALVSSSFWNRPLPAPTQSLPGPGPIFIVGMHRSGTTLLERILGRHSAVQEAGELYDFPAQLRFATGRHFNGPSDISVLEQAATISFPTVGRDYLANVAWRARDRCLVDKLPSNFLNIGYIRHAMPNAKVIHMQRNPMDTCFSNLKELFSTACAYSYVQDEMADYFHLYRSLMAHWKRVMPDFVLDVSYEELTADPEAQARRVLAFCGLPWEPGCLDISSKSGTVSTASSAQVRQPIHRRSVEAWTRYATQLEPLRIRLERNGSRSSA